MASPALTKALDELSSAKIAWRSDDADRVSYARDLFPRHHMAVRAGHVAAHAPGAIAWPTSTEQVATLVRWAISHQVTLVPFGAGSGVCAGVLPTPDSLVVDLKRMAAVRALDAERPTVTVEAGSMGLPFEEWLNRRGLSLGHFPSSILCSTVGGWVAARSAGQASGLYGKIEDMVVSLECVTGRGDVARLVHRPNGPSLVPAIVGSEGTLAIVTAAKLRLHRAPTVRGFASWSFPSVRAGWEAMREMFQAGLRPAVLRLYDPFDAMLARRGSVRQPGKGGRAPGRGQAALRSLLKRPKLLGELLESQAASAAFGGSLLVCIFDGHDERVFADVARASGIAARGGGTSEGEAPARKWLLHRYSISYRQAPLLAQGLFVDTMEVAATWSRLGALYDGVRRAIGSRAFVMAHLSHAYPDGCCIYFSFAGVAKPGAGTWDEACEARYDEIWRDGLAAALAAGGTLAHHHGIGRSKAPRLGEEIGHGMALQRALKRAFDPHGVLNPGALLPPIAPNPFVPDAFPSPFEASP
ncbi:MAG TPA: FAD-binding oxidoreductase [Polyangiaceae bacterium]|nr:FAD-binding oxidoreductase [Polyangiaceae bacterium]